MGLDILSYIHHCQQRVNTYLKKTLPSSNREPRQLHKAMRYAVLSGGKRLRSALIYATGEALDADPHALDICCAAIELIHTFSLIQDDLPVFDNDAIRRGRLACHKAFGEATALLACDSLLVLAYKILSGLDQYLSPETTLKMIRILSDSIGSLGMAGGQVLDITLTNKTASIKKLSRLYTLKTSYLIWVSILFGALCANCNNNSILDNLKQFGLYIGLAFQVHDDIIGIESKTKILGKPQNSDIKKRKPTYPQLIGLDKAKQKEAELLETAERYIKQSGIEYEKLLALSEFVIARRF